MCTVEARENYALTIPLTWSLYSPSDLTAAMATAATSQDDVKGQEGDVGIHIKRFALRQFRPQVYHHTGCFCVHSDVRSQDVVVECWSEESSSSCPLAAIGYQQSITFRREGGRGKEEGGREGGREGGKV